MKRSVSDVILPSHLHMLRLSIIRGPLNPKLRGEVFAEYTRLTGSHFSEANFTRWVEESSEGPAVHAFLTTPEGNLAGHICAFPFPVKKGNTVLCAAKAEYFFIKEEFRKLPVSPSASPNLPAAVILVRELRNFCLEEMNWDPIFCSAPPEISLVHRAAGAKPVVFDLQECFLVMRPFRAFYALPNIKFGQRLALCCAGLVQSPKYFLSRLRKIRKPLLPQASPLPVVSTGYQFCDDQAFLDWRYPKIDFQICRDGLANGRLVTNVVVGKSFLRVVDWCLDKTVVDSALETLMRKAEVSGAVGIRWPIYLNLPESQALIGKLRQRGFFCVSRQRKLSLFTRVKERSDSGNWWFTDMLVSFDHA